MGWSTHIPQVHVALIPAASTTLDLCDKQSIIHSVVFCQNAPSEVLILMNVHL